MYYIRKVEKTKWDGKILHDSVSISDLSTDDNDISVWMDDNSPNKYKHLLLAFVLTTGKIRDLYYVRIPDVDVSKKGLGFNLVPSTTPYINMRSMHTNIVIPTLYELGDLAEIIYDITSAGNQQYIAEQDLKELFYDAVKNDLIEIDFNNKKYQGFRKPLREIEKQKGDIDFSKLKNCKEIMPSNTEKCPTCKGTGRVRKKI